MATTATASLCSHLSALSFSSHLSASSHPLSLPLPAGKPRPLRLSAPKTRPLAFSAAAAATGFAEAPAEEIGTVDLEKYVKSRLPGGFAAQKFFGTGRRKCAIARVVLQEGTGKFIINYRDAKVRFFSLFLDFTVLGKVSF